MSWEVHQRDDTLVFVLNHGDAAAPKIGLRISGQRHVVDLVHRNP